MNKNEFEFKEKVFSLMKQDSCTCALSTLYYNILTKVIGMPLRKNYEKNILKIILQKFKHTDPVFN